MAVILSIVLCITLTSHFKQMYSINNIKYVGVIWHKNKTKLTIANAMHWRIIQILWCPSYLTEKITIQTIFINYLFLINRYEYRLGFLHKYSEISYPVIFVNKCSQEGLHPCLYPALEMTIDKHASFQVQFENVIHVSHRNTFEPHLLWREKVLNIMLLERREGALI